jgi:hypothetical protein
LQVLAVLGRNCLSRQCCVMLVGRTCPGVDPGMCMHYAEWGGTL